MLIIITLYKTLTTIDEVNEFILAPENSIKNQVTYRPFLFAALQDTYIVGYPYEIKET